MLDRLKRAIEAGRSAAALAEKQHSDPMPATQYSIAPPDQVAPPPRVEPDPLIALLVLDEIGSTAPELIKRHQTAAKVAGTKALFIVGPMSEADFFWDQTLLCEYLPSHEDIFRATEERADVIKLYRQHRLRLILDKWRVEECSWIGDTAGDLVAGLQSDDDSASRTVRFRKF